MYLYVPENLDLSLFDGFRKEYRWKLLFVLSTLYFVRVTNKTHGPDDFIPLSQEALHRFIDRNFVRRVREDLVRLGIVEVDRSGRRGTKGNGCLGYRFADAYRHRRFKTLPNTRATGRPPIETTSESHAYLLGHLEHVSILPEAAAEIEVAIAENPDGYRDPFDAYNSGLISIHLIREGRWFFKTDARTGRVFHNVSNLNRRARPFLRYDGRKLSEVDISNCQPLLLYSLYSDRGGQEARRYLALVESGRFYERLQVLCEEFDRDRIKRQFLTYLFGKNHLKTRAGKAFEGQFQELAGVIRGMKTVEHNRAAIALQKLEAALVIGAVVPICAELHIPVVTIHDSLMTLPEHVPAVRDALRAECERLYGIVPDVKEKAA